MKKSLLAVAAMTAFAGAAQAQSSVTVYGILDVGYVGSTYKGTAGSVNAASEGNGANPGSVTTNGVSNSIGQSAESTSRLGFKGSEDMGGGLSAIFTVEVGLSPNQNTQLAWNRQTFAGLNKKGLGTVTIGNQYTPIFDVQSITDAAGNNNLVGNAVYSASLQSTSGTFNGGLGAWNGAANGAVANTAGATGSVNAGLTAESAAYVTRASNALKIQSDRIGGVAGQLYYSQSNSSSTQYGLNYAGSSATAPNVGGGVANNTVIGGNLDYVWQKLQVVAAYQAFRSYDPSAGNAGLALIASGATIAGGTPSTIGLNALDNQTYAAATYDFGILKAYLQWGNRKVTSIQDASWTSSRTAQQIGVKGNLTPTITAYATAGMGNSALFGQSLGKQNFRTFQIGSDYYLSKRTNLYVAYGAYNQSSNGNTASGAYTTNTGASQVATSGANYALGLRHTF